MEDDDEFGDLYTDVLQPFAYSSFPPAPPVYCRQTVPNQEHSEEQQTHRDVELARAPAPHMNPNKESDVDLMHQDVKFDIEDEDDGGGGGIGGTGSETVIPGISGDAEEASRRIDERGEVEDWDSDSDDDLKIVLNDNNNLMTMEMGEVGMVADEEYNDDNDGLNIVAVGDLNQVAEEQEGGVNTTQPVEGERKDAAEVGKAGGGVTAAPKIGYSHQGFHPFHSPFKVSGLVASKD